MTFFMLESDYIDGDGIGVQLYKVISARDGVMKKKFMVQFRSVKGLNQKSTNLIIFFSGIGSQASVTYALKCLCSRSRVL